MSLIDNGGPTSGLLTRLGVYIGDAFVTGAPSMWIGTIGAAAIVWRRCGGTIRRLPPPLAARIAPVLAARQTSRARQSSRRKPAQRA